MMELSNSCAKSWPSVYWNLLHASTPSSLRFLYLVQVVDKPTRGDQILDLKFTSNKALVDNVHIEEPLFHRTIVLLDLILLVILV